MGAFNSNGYCLNIVSSRPMLFAPHGVIVQYGTIPYQRYGMVLGVRLLPDCCLAIWTMIWRRNPPQTASVIIVIIKVLIIFSSVANYYA
jgi:hypothetical protein